MNDHNPTMDRLEDAIIDTVAHAFCTLFRLPVSWQRGEWGGRSADGIDESVDTDRRSVVRCAARIHGPLEGLGLVDMPGRTARSLAGLMRGRDWQEDQRATADALADLTETLLIGAAERAVIVAAATTECELPRVTFSADDEEQGALMEANTRVNRVRVSFRCDCGPFTVQIEFRAEEEEEPEIRTAARAALCAC